MERCQKADLSIIMLVHDRLREIWITPEKQDFQVWI